jgi:hypothetical protein
MSRRYGAEVLAIRAVLLFAASNSQGSSIYILTDYQSIRTHQFPQAHDIEDVARNNISRCSRCHKFKYHRQNFVLTEKSSRT